MSQQHQLIIILSVLGLILVSLVGCQVWDRPDWTPTTPAAESFAVANYAQMHDGSTVVDGQQINWVVSEWGSLPYGYWIYVEVNQQDAVGQPPGEHQVPVTLGDVVLHFSDLPDAVTQILIGVKAVHDDTDDTFTEIGRFTVVDGSVSMPLAYADLVSYFGVTHYSIWFQVIGGDNGEGIACGHIALSGVMPGGHPVYLSKRVCVGTHPASTPSPASTTPTVADTDGDGVPDASDNCPAVPNPQQVATDPNSGCRLIDNNDGTVTDMNNGLTWELTPNNSFQNWMTAQATCIGSGLAGYSDWRLPSVNDYRQLTGGTLVCSICPCPGLNCPFNWHLPAGHPFQSVQNWYWTSSGPADPLDPAPAGGAWRVEFTGGLVLDHTQTLVTYVWCVRG